jgi:hypothetical protein
MEVSMGDRLVVPGTWIMDGQLVTDPILLTFLEGIFKEWSEKHIKLRNECYDCGGYVMCYMVHDCVWLLAWPEYDELRVRLNPPIIDMSSDQDVIVLNLCFDCLQRRLGRKLCIEDFTDCEANNYVQAEILQYISKG